MLKKVGRFFKIYKQFGLVILSIVIALILDITGQDKYAHLVLAISAIANVIPLIWGMYRTLQTGKYGIDILAVTAIITSVILKEYWAGMVIVLMLTGGEALEDYAERRAKKEVTALLNQKPKKAHILRAGKTIDVSVNDVKIGDKLMVYPGEVVPVDAVIVDGKSSFDESSLTGESLPVSKVEQEQILSGSINMDGAVTVKAIRSAEDSQYQQIIKLVNSASSSQSPFVRVSDRYSLQFTVIAFMIAGTAWVLSGDPVRFLEVLVVATPCPFLLAAPIALISGMSRAAKNGIIVKTGTALEKLANIETLAFDKTGTLTRGIPVVENVKTFGNFTEEAVLGVAAALEQNSTHVLAKAIVAKARDKTVKIQKAKQVKEDPGQGLFGRINGKSVHVGRLSHLIDLGVEIPKSFKADSIKQTATYVAINNQLAGVIQFIDEVRPESKIMLEQLKKAGIKYTLMVTGDNATAANRIAKELGISEVVADALPADKIHAIEGVKHKPVGFVGDGVNDAPVLTAADVGIALGARGSTAASESADVIIMLDDVGRVATAVKISKRTFGIARQSILVGITMSVALMLIFATGRFRAVTGAALQEVIDVVVILNALRAHGSFRSKKS